MNEPETMLEMLGGRERAPRTLAVVGLVGRSGEGEPPRVGVHAGGMDTGFCR